MAEPEHSDSAVDSSSARNRSVERLHALNARIRALEARYGRPSGAVRLLAVSKKKPVSAIRAALEAGQRAFGENYLEEAEQKIDALAEADIEWHFIGTVQSRKTAAIARRFHWVQAVDREKIAQRLSRQRPERLDPLNICLQVNIDEESSKSGAHPQALESLAELCATLPGLRVRGLMCIPAPRTDFNAQRAVCRRLKTLFDRLQSKHPEFDTLSMGMSDDLEAAIAEGSTLVRVGTAIFGPR